MTIKEMMEEMEYENYPPIDRELQKANTDGSETITKKHVQAVYDVYITTDWYKNFLEREKQLKELL